MKPKHIVSTNTVQISFLSPLTQGEQLRWFLQLQVLSSVPVLLHALLCVHRINCFPVFPQVLDGESRHEVKYKNAASSSSPVGLVKNGGMIFQNSRTDACCNRKYRVSLMGSLKCLKQGL